mmetsp:Transcript_23859/g.65546  ORF Transcript_23859/g.65546 Transcript_23859/m.65546 type:complete len:315 (-) Transcript_23859:681-1625(-)
MLVSTRLNLCHATSKHSKIVGSWKSFKMRDKVTFHASNNVEPLLGVTASPPLGFGFSAGGLLFPYYQGIVEGLQEEGLLSHDTPVAGASAGSLIAACAKSGLTQEELLDALLRLARDCRRLGTRKNLGPLLRDILLEVLPADIHERCTSGNVHIAVTEVQSGFKFRPVLLNSFSSKDDLVGALLTSCHIPWYFNGKPTTVFREIPHFDGGFTNFLPTLPGVEESIGVCCFPAGQLGALGSKIQIAPDTFEPWPYTFRQMLSWALEPADDEVLVWLMEKGKRDSLTWSAQRKGGLEAPAPEPTLVLPGSSIVEEP